MAKHSKPTTEMIRLPADVVRALRLRAATADITIGEASRQLMLPREVKHQLGLLEHVEWLHGRLVRRRDDLVNVFKEGNADWQVVDRVLDVLVQLRKEWPEDPDDAYDPVVYGQ